MCFVKFSEFVGGVFGIATAAFECQAIAFVSHRIGPGPHCSLDDSVQMCASIT